MAYTWGAEKELALAITAKLGNLGDRQGRAAEGGSSEMTLCRTRQAKGWVIQHLHGRLRFFSFSCSTGARFNDERIALDTMIWIPATPWVCWIKTPCI